MKFTIPAIALAAALTAGTALAGEGTPTLMFPGTSGAAFDLTAGVPRGWDPSEQDSAVAEVRTGTTQTSQGVAVDQDFDGYAGIDTSKNGAYSNN